MRQEWQQYQYLEVVKKSIGFQEDALLASARSRQKNLSPDDNQRKSVPGWFNHRPATLIFDFSPDSLGPLRSEMHRALTLYRGLACPRGKEGEVRGVLTPQVLARFKLWKPGADEGVSVLVQKRLTDGQRYLDLNSHRRRRFPHSTERQKNRIAELYWETVDNFQKVSEIYPEAREHLCQERGEVSADYFNHQIWKILEAAKRKDLMFRERFQSQNIEVTLERWKERMENFWRTKLPPAIFFRRFRNANLIFQPDSQCFYLTDDQIGVFPLFYGAAYFVWDLLMHAGEQKHTLGWAANEIRAWREAFENQAPSPLKPLFCQGFNNHLLERAATALLISIPLKYGSFGGSAPSIRRQRERAKNIFRGVLEHTSALLGL